MLKRRFPEPEASGGAKRARQLDWDRESLRQQGHRVARSQVEGIPRAWRLQIIDRERLVEPGTQIACVEERLWYQQVPVEKKVSILSRFGGGTRSTESRPV